MSWERGVYRLLRGFTRDPVLSALAVALVGLLVYAIVRWRKREGLMKNMWEFKGTNKDPIKGKDYDDLFELCKSGKMFGEIRRDSRYEKQFSKYLEGYAWQACNDGNMALRDNKKEDTSKCKHGPCSNDVLRQSKPCMNKPDNKVRKCCNEDLKDCKPLDEATEVWKKKDELLKQAFLGKCPAEKDRCATDDKNYCWPGDQSFNWKKCCRYPWAPMSMCKEPKSGGKNPPPAPPPPSSDSAEAKCLKDKKRWFKDQKICCDVGDYVQGSPGKYYCGPSGDKKDCEKDGTRFWNKTTNKCEDGWVLKDKAWCDKQPGWTYYTNVHPYRCCKPGEIPQGKGCGPSGAKKDCEKDGTRFWNTKTNACEDGWVLKDEKQCKQNGNIYWRTLHPYRCCKPGEVPQVKGGCGPEACKLWIYDDHGYTGNAIVDGDANPQPAGSTNLTEMKDNAASSIKIQGGKTCEVLLHNDGKVFRTDQNIPSLRNVSYRDHTYYPGENKCLNDRNLGCWNNTANTYTFRRKG